MPSPRLSDTGSSVNNRSDTSAAHADEWYMRSLLGSQAESRHETAPRYGFGTGQSAAYDIMYGKYSRSIVVLAFLLHLILLAKLLQRQTSHHTSLRWRSILLEHSLDGLALRKEPIYCVK